MSINQQLFLLSKLSDVVKNDILKKAEYNAKIKYIEDKILGTASLPTTAALNSKINVVQNKIPNITNLTTNIALTSVENKIPNVSNLVEKTSYNTKINEIEKKFG